MKILVSGANGFIGRALCPFLSSLGYQVVSAVRRPSGIQDEYVTKDEASWKLALDGCTCIVHLAGLTNIKTKNQSDLSQAFHAANVNTTIALAERAIKYGVRRFVFMSTIKVNGEQTKQGCSFKYDDQPMPHDPYAVSKYEAEQELFEYSKRSGLEIVVIRPPLVYGPGVKGNFAALVRCIKWGLPLPLGAVNNSRSMIAIENLLSFTALVADPNASLNAAGKVFLVSDGQAVSTTELLRKLGLAYGASVRLLPVPVKLIRSLGQILGMSDLFERLLGSLVIDNSTNYETLGWIPQVTMDEQLRKMANAPSHY
jgi:nucleoside-diphosphate-sugar epimerase